LYTPNAWDDSNWIRTEAKELAGIRDLNPPLADNGGNGTHNKKNLNLGLVDCMHVPL